MLAGAKDGDVVTKQSCCAVLSTLSSKVKASSSIQSASIHRKHREVEPRTKGIRMTLHLVQENKGQKGKRVQATSHDKTMAKITAIEAFLDR